MIQFGQKEESTKNKAGVCTCEYSLYQKAQVNTIGCRVLFFFFPNMLWHREALPTSYQPQTEAGVHQRASTHRVPHLLYNGPGETGAK